MASGLEKQSVTTNNLTIEPEKPFIDVLFRAKRVQPIFFGTFLS